MAQTEAEKRGLDISSIGLAFIAGALSVAIFQFGMAELLNRAGLAKVATWPMQAVPPFGVPQTVSYMFWGGLWGILMLPVLRSVGRGLGYWLTAILLGAVVVSAVLLFIVFPLKGRPLAAGWNMQAWATIGALHAAFGLGVAAILRLAGRA